MTVRWTPRFTMDFSEQTVWLEQNRGHAVVTRYFEQVHAAIERLRQGDLILYRLYDAGRHIRYCQVNKDLQLYYRPLPDEVELLTLFSTRQSPDKLQL